MCGIGGVFNCKQGVQPSIALALIAVEMETRGSDSWGSSDGEKVHRCMGAISSNFQIPEVLPENFMFHTRFATQGKVKEGNSHPFIIGGNHLVVGMHNGIISNHYQLNGMYNRDYRVDSQHILGHIANDIPLDDLEGYGTIVYKSDEDWYIGSFNGGELSLAYTEFGIFFASTTGALARALHTARIRGKIEQLVQDVIYRLEGDKLVHAYDVNIGTTKQKWDDKKKGGHTKYLSNQEVRCTSCGGRVWEEDSEYCDLCVRYGDTMGKPIPGVTKNDWEKELDWDIEVIPEGMEYPCDGCGLHLKEFEDAAVNNGKYYCADCFGTEEINSFNNVASNYEYRGGWNGQ